MLLPSFKKVFAQKLIAKSKVRYLILWLDHPYCGRNSSIKANYLTSKLHKSTSNGHTDILPTSLLQGKVVLSGRHVVIHKYEAAIGGEVCGRSGEKEVKLGSWLVCNVQNLLKMQGSEPLVEIAVDDMTKVYVGIICLRLYENTSVRWKLLICKYYMGWSHDGGWGLLPNM